MESDASELDPYEYYAVETQLMKLSHLWQSECDPKLLLTAATTTAPPLSTFPKSFDVILDYFSLIMECSLSKLGVGLSAQIQNQGERR